jgi:Rieske Fe-S protein
MSATSSVQAASVQPPPVETIPAESAPLEAIVVKSATVPRRGAIVALAAAGSALLAILTPVVSGATVFLDPVFRKQSAFRGAKEGFLPAIPAADLPSDGSPRLVTLIADRVDAWNVFVHQAIGKVYLRQIEGQVIAFNNICPHLGCKVTYRHDGDDFLCPCHGAIFAADGACTNEIAPRGMDVLETRVDENGLVWVKYQNFRRGTAEKVAV